MKKIPIISICFLLIFLVSSNVYQYRSDSDFSEPIASIENKSNSEKFEMLGKADLDKLIMNFDIPKQSLENVNFKEEDKVFPIELINQIKTALVDNNTRSLIEELNDESLLVEFSDIETKILLKEETDIYKQRLYNLLYSDYPINYNTSKTFYIIDIDNDKKEEILVIEKNLESDYHSTQMMHVLTKDNENYVYRTSYVLDYNRFCGIFAYNGVYYFIANKDDFETKSTNAVELYVLDRSILNEATGLNMVGEKYINIKKSIDNFNFDLLYKNKTHSITDKAVSYIDTIAADLMYTDKMKKYFYGDEILGYNSLHEQYKDHDNYKHHKPLLSIDVDNSGKKKLFTRYSIYEHYIDYPETTLVWCDHNTLQKYTPDLRFWSNPKYVVTQRWFKEIDKTTLSFSLYHKQGEDIYLLDARIHDNGETIILADYMIYPTNNAYFFEPMPTITDNTTVKIYHSESVFDPVPNLVSIINDFSNDIKRHFSPKIYPNDEIPEDFIILLEEMLYDGSFEELYRLSSLIEADKDNFYQAFHSNNDTVYLYTKELYDERVENIFSYKVNEKQYYFIVLNQKPGHDNNYIYVEESGHLTLHDSWMTENSNRIVVPFQGYYYLVEAFNTPYSKTGEGFVDRFFVAGLDSSQIEDYSVISFIPEEFKWQQVYNLKGNKEHELNNYIKSIQNKLTQGIYLDRETRFYYQQSSTFIGDETKNFDIDKLLRLQSITGFASQYNTYYQFYEIDYDNDGISNYLNKYHVGYSLSCYFYDITEKRTTKVDTSLFDNQTVQQIWFKEIDGKVYTFKLHWLNEYNFYLTVSLIEGKDERLHQVYGISPKRRFDFYKFSINSYFR